MKMTAQTTLREPEYAGVISPEDVENLKKSNKEIERIYEPKKGYSENRA